MSTTAAAANTTESNARNSNAATATATLRLRQAGRTRHEVLALAHTVPLSQSHTHIALDSHSCLVLFVQLRGENKATTQFCIYSPQLLLSFSFWPAWPAQWAVGERGA